MFIFCYDKLDNVFFANKFMYFIQDKEKNYFGFFTWKRWNGKNASTYKIWLENKIIIQCYLHLRKSIVVACKLNIHWFFLTTFFRKASDWSTILFISEHFLLWSKSLLSKVSWRYCDTYSFNIWAILNLQWVLGKQTVKRNFLNSTKI